MPLDATLLQQPLVHPPPSLRAAASAEDVTRLRALDAGARGFAYNADIRTLETFMNIGTSVGRV